MSDARLPAHLEIAGLIRAAETAGGFAAVLAKGDRDAGTILLVTTTRGTDRKAWDRVADREGRRRYQAIERAFSDESDWDDYLSRRRQRDPDLWVLELDIPRAERFVAEWGT